MMARISLLLFLFLLSSAVSAQGRSATLGDTIFKCKGEKGRYVFQQTPCDEKDITGSGPEHVSWQEMKKLSEEGKKILALLGANVESIKKCHRSMSAYRKKIKDLGPTVAQVRREHPLLMKAYTYIRDCAECRTSAESNCRTADEYLIKATSRLGQ